MNTKAVALATMLAFMAACGGDSEWRGDDPSGNKVPDVVTLELTAEDSADVDWRGGSVDFAVKSSADWRASCADDWCVAQPSQGKSGTSKITVNVAANNVAAQRETSLQVIAGNRKAMVKISQCAKPELMLSGTTLSFGGASASQMLMLKCNVDWSASTDASWCSLAPASGKTGTTAVAVSVERNPSGMQRQAAITIVAGGESISVSVVQAAAE